MTKADALKAIKELRDKINDEADVSAEAPGWENLVCWELDKASDVLEFRHPCDWCSSHDFRCTGRCQVGAGSTL